MDFICDKEKCYSCKLCENICPKNAITFKDNEFGFSYPVINKEKCINCGLCKRKCPANNAIKFNEVISSYAVTSKNIKLLLKSSSGAVFSTLAVDFLNNGGIVYGCITDILDGNFIVKHIRVDDVVNLSKLFGSKYVKSDMNNIYSKVKEDLKNGKKVLFSGTPCQINALNLFLNNVNVSNLYTIDIICHGTPGLKFFQDYLCNLEIKLKGKIIDVIFREKSFGWGKFVGKIIYKNKYGKIKELYFKSTTSSYFNLFLSSEIYYDKCYSCDFANKKRVSDITIGDFWGIEKNYSSLLNSNGGLLDNKSGISCVLINSSKGEKLFNKFDNLFYKYEIELDNVIKYNKQLSLPSVFSSNRENVFNNYINYGYYGVEKYFYRNKALKKFLISLFIKLPKKIQMFIFKYK